MTTNAGEELNTHLASVGSPTRKLIAAEILYNNTKATPKTNTIISLYDDNTQKEREDFFKKLDFSYNNGYGAQELFGHLWFSDGTFSERAEYDGSEWWEHRECPPLPMRK